MSFLKNHKQLFGVAFAFFVALTIFAAVMPALDNQARHKPLPTAEPMSEDAIRGKEIFIANGCVACHSQQVRNLAMDKRWGSRPGIPQDYAGMERTDIWRNTATLMGTERTGPDLTDVGNRQGSLDWNLVHLYNPRILVGESIMPSYPWLFEYKNMPLEDDVVVNIPDEFRRSPRGTLVAKKEALQLVAYLQSLKQAPLPEGMEAPEFLYATEKKKSTKSSESGEEGGEENELLQGEMLYADHCQSCHQPNGEGLAGAFPSLQGSEIVMGENLEKYVDIIMNGYDEHPEYGPMSSVGTIAEFTEKEVAAIINYERSSWGNEGEKVSVEEIKEILEKL